MKLGVNCQPTCRSLDHMILAPAQPGPKNVGNCPVDVWSYKPFLLSWLQHTSEETQLPTNYTIGRTAYECTSHLNMKILSRPEVNFLINILTSACYCLEIICNVTTIYWVLWKFTKQCHLCSIMSEQLLGLLTLVKVVLLVSKTLLQCVTPNCDWDNLKQLKCPPCLLQSQIRSDACKR